MKPSDFYMGMSEFLSVLIPGFIVSAVVSDYFGLIDFEQLTPRVWVLLPIVSYIVGHILFALGSYWDTLYDKFKPKGNEELLKKVGEIRRCNQKADCAEVNHYKWCRSLLSKEHPEGYAEVLRKEADSKLFRSLILPLIILSLFLYFKADLEQYRNWFLLSEIIVLIAFWRYRGQRFKACKIAYTHAIVLFQLGLLNLKPAPDPDASQAPTKQDPAAPGEVVAS